MQTVLLSASGQAITGFNLSYLYDPDAEVTMELKPVRQGRIINVLYRFTANRKEYTLSEYDIQWERRATVNSRSGDITGLRDSVWVVDEQSRTGIVIASGTDKTGFLVAKVTNRSTRGLASSVALSRLQVLFARGSQQRTCLHQVQLHCPQ